MYCSVSWRIRSEQPLAMSAVSCTICVPPCWTSMVCLARSARRSGRIAGSSLDVNIEAPEQLPPLPAAVEVAAYRIVTEALTNVVRHAAAEHCVIRVQIQGSVGEHCNGDDRDYAS